MFFSRTPKRLKIEEIDSEDKSDQIIVDESDRIRKTIEKNNENHIILVSELKKKLSDLEIELSLRKEKYEQKISSFRMQINTKNDRIKSIEKEQKKAEDPSLYSNYQQYIIMKNDLTLQIDQLKDTLIQLVNKEKQLQSSVAEIRFVMDSLPSGNDELFELAKKQIVHYHDTTINSQIQTTNECVNRLSDIKGQISLTEALIDDLTKENNELSESISSLKAKVIKQTSLKQQKLDQINSQTGMYPLSILNERKAAIKSETRSIIKSLVKKAKEMHKQYEYENQTIQNELNDHSENLRAITKKFEDLTAEMESEKDKHHAKIQLIHQKYQKEIDDIKERITTR